MLVDRNIRLSGMARVRSLLESPPGGSGLSAFTVYAEAQLRQVQAKMLTPVYPRVFLVDSYIRPAEPALPLIAVMTAVTVRPFELGRRGGRRTQFFFNVIGRDRGQRDDLASFLADNFGASLTINDYTTGSPVLIESGVVEPEIEIETVPVRDELREEFTLDAWAMVSLAVLTKN